MWRRYRITSADEVRDALALTQSAIRAQQEQARNVVELRPAAEGQKAWNTDRTRTIGRLSGRIWSVAFANNLILWCARQESNLRPSDSKSDALSN
jgi:hypothetical protein